MKTLYPVTEEDISIKLETNLYQLRQLIRFIENYEKDDAKGTDVSFNIWTVKNIKANLIKVDESTIKSAANLGDK